MTAALRGAALAVVAALLAAFAEGAAAYDGFVAPVDEIPLTAPSIGGARAMGMGGAGIAALEDASACYVNPAALARMRRIELSGGLSKSSDDLSGTAFGEEFGTDLSRTNLSSIRFAYPFPTFRGSLVVGLSGNSVYDLDDDFLAAYDDSLTWEESEGEFLTELWAQVEDQITEGGIYAWTLAGAFDASPSVSLGASVSYWTGDMTRRFQWTATDEFDVSDAYDRYTLETTTDVDVSGFRAKVGALFYAGDSFSAAVTVDSPVTLTFDGAERTRESLEGDHNSSSDETVYFSDEVTLPFSFAAGGAYTPNDFIVVAADVVYTDWSEMTYEGFLYLDDPTERQTAYEATTEVRLGAEVSVPSWPLRLRTGYMTRPIAYRGLEVDSDRSYFTLGAGVLIDTVFTVDVAWITGGYERSAADYDYSEEVSESGFVVEAAYRF